MDRRNPDQEMYDKMCDIIELICILNRLTNNNCSNECSRDCLLDLIDDVEDNRCNCKKHRMLPCHDGRDGRDRFFCGKNENFVDKLIFFLKSLND